jgi:hypothetical protein
MGAKMGQPEKRAFGIIHITKLWVIRLILGSSVALFAKKIDSYLDAKFGPSDYDKRIIEVWANIKGFF